MQDEGWDRSLEIWTESSIPFYSTKMRHGIGLSVSRSIIENLRRLWAAPMRDQRHVFIFYSALAEVRQASRAWRQLDPGSDRCGHGHEEFLMVVRSLLLGNRRSTPTKTEASRQKVSIVFITGGRN